jgi:hypothetical protein
MEDDTTMSFYFAVINYVIIAMKMFFSHFDEFFFAGFFQEFQPVPSVAGLLA